MKSSDFLKYKLFEPGLKKATMNNMCDSLNYTEYKETQTHGFGSIKMTVDLYKKHPKVSAATAASAGRCCNSKCNNCMDPAAKPFCTASKDHCEEKCNSHWCPADALILAVGPVHPAKSVALPPITPKSVAGVIAGLLDGFVEENKLTEIEACYDGGKPLEADLAKALADAKADNIPAAIEDLMAVVAAFPAELANCKAVSTDLSAVIAWAQIFKDTTKLKATIEKNLLVHHKAILADVASVEADYTGGKYFDAGKAAADALILAVGPVHPAKSVALPPITPKAVAGVIAGLLDGFVEENKLTEIEACYDGGKPLEADLAKALADAKAKNIPAAIEDLMAVAAAFPAELANCKAVSTDLSAVIAWAQIFKDTTKLKATVEKNLLVHHKAILADVASIEADYTGGKYMDAGKAAADALILAVGPVHPAVSARNPCEGKYKDKSSCDANAACSWCLCSAVPSACHTIEDAAGLPSSIFQCDKLNAKVFLQ